MQHINDLISLIRFRQSKKGFFYYSLFSYDKQNQKPLGIAHEIPRGYLKARSRCLLLPHIVSPQKESPIENINKHDKTNALQIK